jgi:glycosyltransferase involved in cell wall biosynthesis
MSETQTPAESVPFLSVTVLNYNYAHYLPICLDSILAQTMQDFELIIINDRSTDNSLEVIKRYVHDPRIRLIDHAQNMGFVASLIEGSEASTGDYISVISADDYVLSATAFAQARAVLEPHPDVVLCYSAWQEVDDAGQAHWTRRAADADYVRNGVDQFRQQILTSYILHSGAIMKRSAYQQAEGYDARCHYAVDNNMWLVMCTLGQVAYINDPHYAYRAHAANMSNSPDALKRTIEEMVLGIDTAVERFSDKELPDKRAIRRRGLQSALLAVAGHDIFAGRLRRGWTGYWYAFRSHPALTLFQPRILTFTARTVLGARGYAALRGTVDRVMKRAPDASG